MGPVHEPYAKLQNGFDMIDLQKHIREGWTVSDFVERLAPELDRIMSGHGWHCPFTTKQELAVWCRRISPITKSTFRALLPILPGSIVYIDSSRR